MASKRRQRRLGCEGKRRYVDMTAALDSRRFFELRAYCCPLCRTWHLGHPGPGIKDRSIGLAK